MFLTLLKVAAGGAIGASLRYLSGVAILRLAGPSLPIPLGVLTANILGSFLMGALVVYIGHKGLTGWNPFLATGILGGFTTFSSFSLEALTLFERGQAGLAALYVGLSVIISLAAIVAGTYAMRGILA
ncbi:camphor resistance protein CrcB [Pseudooceanicola antarcticus]|uniref:Fluoride-specific ion channel FluC n=1 Tax=Pseudooceanicola antarcticus TaxID=1247613 RepID=A0A285ITN6_9RHOB|nr:fluoride efflux transporter CrcB [Pseudooceanicola antarcticus]PJE31735.1 fluoride efflux transporter CrcB [Pseudooceanicola antarcticus]SNY50301.1 camphor resistance protein CrcB [Pseudooceanicola antarcticus]